MSCYPVKNRVTKGSHKISKTALDSTIAFSEIHVGPSGKPLRVFFFHFYHPS